MRAMHRITNPLRLMLLCSLLGLLAPLCYAQDIDMGRIVLDHAGVEEASVVQAKIYNRKGMTARQLDLFRDLRDRYPEDEVIWEEYVRALILVGQYDPAIRELQQFLQEFPLNVKAQKLMISIYYRQQRYAWTYGVFEDALRLNNNDSSLWSRYARSRSATGDWSAALNYWQNVLELDNENSDAHRQIVAILWKHRPQLDVGFEYSSRDNGTDITTYTVNYGRHLSAAAWLDFFYDQQTIEVDSKPGVKSSTTVEYPHFRLHYRFNQRWQGEAGMGVYSGIGNDTSYEWALNRQVGDRGTLRVAYEYHQPWLDSSRAVQYEGYYHTKQLSLKWHFDHDLSYYLGVEERDQYLSDGSSNRHYGQRYRLNSILTKRLGARPIVFLVYHLQYSDFDYEDDNLTPSNHLDSEFIHSLAVQAVFRPADRLDVTLGGGSRYDFDNAVNSWYVNPGVKVRLGKRMELQLNYEYSSEDTSAVYDGESHTVNCLLTTIF